jgi:hypothetical protein
MLVGACLLTIGAAGCGEIVGFDRITYIDGSDRGADAVTRSSNSDEDADSGVEADGGDTGVERKGGRPPSCPPMDGLFCGPDVVGGDPDTLYCCYKGNISAIQICQGGCERMPPGINDRCSVQACPRGNGLYCGGIVPGCPGTLYQCADGNLTVASECQNGCQPALAGQNDYCR